MKVRSYYKSIIFTFFISTPSFSCDYIDDQYERRRGKYNNQRTETSFVEHTENTNKLLSDYNKVSNVPATLDQKKSIIKTTMTKFFVHANPEQYKLSLSVLEKTDKNYKHFKVLEQTEALSSKLARQLVDKDGVKTINRDMLSKYWNDHKELDEFGQITQEMFSLWFDEALSDHNKGLSRLAVRDFVDAAPTSAQRFSPNLSITVYKKPVNNGENFPHDHFSPITREEAIVIGECLLNDSDAQCEKPSSTIVQECHSTTTTPENFNIITTPNLSLSADNPNKDDDERSTGLYFSDLENSDDSDNDDDFLCITPMEKRIGTALSDEDEWDDLADINSPTRKGTRTFGALFSVVPQNPAF